jgi:hypothetical protein
MEHEMPRAKSEDTGEHDLAMRSASTPSVMVGPADDMGAKEEARQKAAEKDAKHGKTGKAREQGRTFTVTIHPGPGNDMSDVVIGHNYVLNVYKRNVPVQMTEVYLNVLRDAVVSTDVPTADGTMQAVTIPQYSYTVDQ